MSLYRVQTFEPGYIAEVGKIEGGYFYAIYPQGHPVPESHGGLDDPIRSLFELLTVTWSEINWTAERSTAMRLLTEANSDQKAIAELFAGFATTP